MQHVNPEEIILIADPRILSVAIAETDEPMIDLRDQAEIVYGLSPEVPNNTDYTKMRRSIYEKLKQAQALLPSGLRFCLYEAYRSFSLQKMLFDSQFQKNRAQYPSWSEHDIFTETTKLISPVVNEDGSKNIPPHATGGAVDVYLIDDAGEYVDMGIHPKDWMEDRDGSLSLTTSRIISDEAQRNRRIMSEALSAVGFVNYPTEYWHWSYGDRYWAYHKKQLNALYDSHPGNTKRLDELEVLLSERSKAEETAQSTRVSKFQF
ncbi:MAG TPA: M15 family metallopeptidase [Gammaproteobacteria bacterium]|jgi:D-alanyl-D-alanine dipeptidase|nr:M15 family metallopeptidase [Gammaproteobacteria bacterium]